MQEWEKINRGTVKGISQVYSTRVAQDEKGTKNTFEFCPIELFFRQKID